MNSAHTRHNIFKAEPPALKSKKYGSAKPVDSEESDQKESPGHGRVSFDLPSSKPSSPAVQSPATSPSQSLPEIEWNARKKLAIKDLSVKFTNKSPAFNVASNYGHPSPESKKFGSSNKLEDAYFVYDQEDDSSVSKASRNSNTSTRLDLFKESRSNHSKSKHSIAGNSYFFNDNHSIVEVEDEDNYDDTEIEEDLSVQVPHPKTFSSPVDAHRSFVKAARARNQIRSTKSMAASKLIPSEMMASESKKALMSMKKESQHSLPKAGNSEKPSSPNSSFYFLTGLLGGRTSPSANNENSHSSTDVLGQKAPLESFDRPIVERPLLPSTFSRFKIGKEAENPALILRSMESTKQKMKSEFEYDDNWSVSGANNKEKSPVHSLYNVPKIQAHENKTFLKTVDSVINALTFVPSPPKPEPPPPIPKEPLTLENVFGEHLIRAKVNKVVPEEEYQKLLKMSSPKIPAKIAEDDTTFSTNDWGSASYCTFNEPLPPQSQYNDHFHLPRLDFSPLQQDLQQRGSNSSHQSTAGSYLHLPKINPHHNAHKQVINPQLTTEHSTMKSYFQYMSKRAQQYLMTFIKNREISGNDKDAIAQKMLEDLQAEPQPLADPNQEYVYQHSTTSYVPKDYVNRSELGYDYGSSPEVRQKAVDSLEKFSDRHLSAIEKHTVGVSEPVIYLPVDYSGNNKNGIVANLDEESQVRILTVPSSSVTDILRPGYVLAKPNYPDAHDIITSNDRDHILHYNIFEDEEGDSEDEGGQDIGGAESKGSDRKKVPQLTNLPNGHYVKSLDEDSFYTNYDPGYGAVKKSVEALAAVANDDQSVGKRSVLSDERSLDSFQRNTKSVSKSVGQQKSLHAVPSELDLRDEILSFLQKVDSPLKTEYEQYMQKTSPGQKLQGGSYANEPIADFGQYDDNSTIASEAPSHVNYVVPPFHSTAHMMNITPPPATNMTATHQKLWRNLQSRYAKDDEGNYHMQRKVKDYLMDGVKQDYKIKNKYLDEMEEW